MLCLLFITTLISIDLLIFYQQGVRYFELLRKKYMNLAAILEFKMAPLCSNLKFGNKQFLASRYV